jgi:sterol desaturase/sphingolipid hydroxylase (fatty acid hydroxylase superfamily)
MDDAIGIGLVARPLLFVALAALAFIPLEHIAAAHAQRRRRFATDLAFATFGHVLVRLGLVLVVGWVLARLDAAAPDRPLLAAIGDRRARFVVETSVGLLLFELAGYGYHRLAHAVPRSGGCTRSTTRPRRWTGWRRSGSTRWRSCC